MASSENKVDPAEYDPAKDEPADYGELDYDYTPVSEKIAAGIKAKELGNGLFRKGEYEAAWKQYDRAFVHIYTSKEEWEAIGPQWRAAINDFKLPCHLNRGLCRLRRDDLDNALWDFSEALRINGVSVKAMYRRALVFTRLVKGDLKKEEEGIVWNFDKAQERADEAKSDLMRAVKICPNDLNIRKAIDDLKAVRKDLAVLKKKYQKEQKALYSNLISNLDKDNQRRKEEEEKEIFKDMPALERIRIS